MKKSCGFPINLQWKSDQFPPADAPVRPLTVSEVDFLMKKLFEWISAHDRHTRRSVIRTQAPSTNAVSLSGYISSQKIARILAHVCAIFNDEDTLLKVNVARKNSSSFGSLPSCASELVVCGDIHGSIRELLAIFYRYNLPPSTTYIFLGDYVDRGKHSLAVLLLIFLLKIRWPSNFFLLRGNHESFVVTSSYGFRKECEKHFPDESIYGMINVVFAYIPLAAIIQDSVFCCHGGISQWMYSRQSVATIPRPVLFENLSLFEHLIVTDIMWSDPDIEQKQRFSPSIDRGCGYCFNEVGLRQVLRLLKCSFLIRAHESKANGVEELFGSRCITVHSTALQMGDRAATLKITFGRQNNAHLESRIHCRNDARRLRPVCEHLYNEYVANSHFPMKKIINPKVDLRPFLKHVEDRRFFRRNIAGQDELFLWVKLNAGPFFAEYCRKKKIRHTKMAAVRIFPLLLAVAFGDQVDKHSLSQESVRLLYKFFKHCGQQRFRGLMIDEEIERFEIADDRGSADDRHTGSAPSSTYAADRNPSWVNNNHSQQRKSPTSVYLNIIPHPHQTRKSKDNTTITKDYMPPNAEPTSLPRIRGSAALPRTFMDECYQQDEATRPSQHRTLRQKPTTHRRHRRNSTF